MKIHKSNDLSLFIKTFGLKNELFLALSVFVFFDLNDPDVPLPEQELWQSVPDQLGPQVPLDLGLPKPRGEFLVAGSCFAPRDQYVSAGQVSVRVGPKEKTLAVFGHRLWLKTAGLTRSISRPLPFSEMPITYRQAFGGPGFPPNPLGKGFEPFQLRSGDMLHALPNVEYLDLLVGDPIDTPPPASFGPVDQSWPPRSKKAGTYGDAWLRDRWPYYPDNLNFEFFNAAPEDQLLPEFIKPGTHIAIDGMHPDVRTIQSHVPRVRVRAFVTKRKSLKADNREQVFAEAQTAIDTLWLFPTLLRGVALFRGTTRVLDDEMADVDRIFLAWEDIAAPAKPMDYFYQAQLKALDLTVPVDQEPLEKAKKRVAEALKRIRALPKEIQTAKLKALGQAPKMPPPSPAEMGAKAGSIMAQSTEVLNRMEALAQGFHAQYGHMARVPLDVFPKIRDKMKTAQGKIDRAVQKAETAKAQAEELKKEAGRTLKAQVSPEDLAKAGIDPDNLIPGKKTNPWHDRGFPLVVAARKRLEADPEALNRLGRLGISRRTAKRAWMGIQEEPVNDPAGVWGLKPDPQDNQEVVLPPGLLLPRFNGPVLNRIAVRPGDWEDARSEVLALGSEDQPLALWSEPGAPVVIVGEELAARLLEQEVGDACAILVLKTPGEDPGEAAEALTEVPILVAISKAQHLDQAFWPRWQKAFPEAMPLILPQGRTLFEARQAGTDLRTWVLDALPQDFSESRRVEPTLPEPGRPPKGSPVQGIVLPPFDIKKLIAQTRQEVETALRAKFAPLEAMKKEAEDTARAALVGAGLDPKKYPAGPGAPSGSFADMGREAVQQINSEKERIRAAGRLTPDIEAKMDAAAQKAGAMTQDAQGRFEAGLAELEAKKKEALKQKAQVKAGTPPEAAREKLAAAGLDPDRIRKVGREELIRRHQEGESLAGAIISGLDLSGLDLTGIDLGQAQCQKTDFSHTQLTRAKLNQALAMEANFSGADLTGAVMEKGLFIKAKFVEANLSEANLFQAVMRGADLSRAVLQKALLNWTVFQKAVLPAADLSETRAEMAIFFDTDLTKANFHLARLIKCLFKGADVSQADFSRATLDSTMFLRTRATGLNFQGANLDRFRIAGASSLTGSDFRGVSLNEACFRESDLSGSRFEGSWGNQALLEAMNFSYCSFYRSVLKQCRFNKSNLEGANFRAVNLMNGSLRKARLVNTDLSLSNLFGVDFFKAVLGNTRFNLANLKRTFLYGRTDLLD